MALFNATVMRAGPDAIDALRSTIQANNDIPPVSRLGSAPQWLRAWRSVLPRANAAEQRLCPYKRALCHSGL